MQLEILEFLSKINSPELQEMFWWLKLLFFAVIALFIFPIVVSFTSTPYVRLSMVGDTIEILTYRPFGFPKIRQRWLRIMRRLDTGSEAEYKLAVIEADTLLNEMLQKMRIAGETVDERLQKITPFMIPNMEELRKIHQIRNSIVYDPDYRLPLSEARRVLLVYQKSFEELDLFR